MIKIKNLKYKWDDERNALNGINLTIPTGQFVLITGESGCGKSTLGCCINGLIPHFYEKEYEGSVIIDGKNIGDMPLYDIGKRVGSVFQDPRSQFFTTTTDEELAFGCRNLGVSTDEIWARVDDTYRTLKLEAFVVAASLSCPAEKNSASPSLPAAP